MNNFVDYTPLLETVIQRQETTINLIAGIQKLILLGGGIVAGVIVCYIFYKFLDNVISL